MEEKNRPDDIWIISMGRYIDLDLSRIYEGVATKTVSEYKLSELGRYLLNPNPIQVNNEIASTG